MTTQQVILVHFFCISTSVFMVFVNLEIFKVFDVTYECEGSTLLYFHEIHPIARLSSVSLISRPVILIIAF